MGLLEVSADDLPFPSVDALVAQGEAILLGTRRNPR